MSKLAAGASYNVSVSPRQYPLQGPKQSQRLNPSSLPQEGTINVIFNGRNTVTLTVLYLVSLPSSS